MLQPQNFLPDLGGVLGLWLGVSILTLFEFCEFGLDAIVLVTAKWLRKRKFSNPTKAPHVNQISHVNISQQNKKEQTPSKPKQQSRICNRPLSYSSTQRQLPGRDTETSLSSAGTEMSLLDLETETSLSDRDSDLYPSRPDTETPPQPYLLGNMQSNPHRENILSPPAPYQAWNQPSGQRGRDAREGYKNYLQNF